MESRESEQKEKKKVAVIVGGGVAGTSCALQLHSLAPSTQILLIDPRPSLKLCRVLSPVTSTIQETDICEENAEPWCRHRNITFLRSRAIALSLNRVTVEDGSHIQFDTCCLASGARPFIPSALRNPKFAHCVLPLRDTDSIECLRRSLSSARRVLVVGAGGIGMEVVHEISGCELVWVVKGTHIGGLFFDERVASFIESHQNLANMAMNSPHSELSPELLSKNVYTNVTSENEANKPESMSASAVGPNWMGQRERATLFDTNGEPIISDDSEKARRGGRLEANTSNPTSKDSSVGYGHSSVRVFTQCEVVELQSDKTGNWAVNAKLSNGTSISCDVIIVGTGVSPNVEWTHDSGLVYGDDGGISVRPNEMKTNIGASLFAAGDCTHVVEDLQSDWVQIRTWGQALAGGRAAANGMAICLGIAEENIGMGLEFDVFAHSTRFFGQRIVLLGRWKAQGLPDGFTILEGNRETSFVQVVLHNGRVRGAVLVGDVDNAEVFENLIVGQMDVAWMGEDLVDESIDLENYFD